ncbi:hypothetical protein [Pendulispora albinea]|uniref:Uncharacterized protein n=1 Tax=Pendulispora albinea TaxID=2741071 RepID=A0ABZ2MB33_9BACT
MADAPGDANEAKPDPLTRAGEWNPRVTIAGFSGALGIAPEVFDFAKDKDGRVVAVGGVKWFGKTQVDHFAAYDHDEWKPAHGAWSRPVPETGFSAVAFGPRGELALSTYSGPLGGVAEQEIWLETSAGLSAIGHFRGTIRSLTWFKGKLWAAGLFRMTDGGVQSLAVWDGAMWTAPPGGAVDGAVYQLVAQGDNLLVAGGFMHIGGIEAHRVAEWNGTSWRAYSLDLPGRAYTVLRDPKGDLLVGGNLEGGLLRWTGTAWEPVGGGLSHGAQPVVAHAIAHKGSIYAAGCFNGAGSPAVRAASIARWTGAAWESLDDGTAHASMAWFQFGTCGNEISGFTLWDVRFQRLFSDGERLFVGGWFPGIAGQRSQSIMVHHDQRWVPQGKTERGLWGSADAVVSGPGNKAYVLGAISHAGDVPSRQTPDGSYGVFRYDDGWTAVGGPTPSDLHCSRIAAHPSSGVFLGCNQGRASVILKLDGDQWIRLGALAVRGVAWEIRTDPNGRLWVLGGERTGESAGSGFVARWDDDHFTVVESGFDSMVFSIDFEPTGAVIVGGAFKHVGTKPASRIARFDGTTWQALGEGLTHAVAALAWAPNTLYAATEPAVDESAPRIALGQWNGSTWTDIATPERGLPRPAERAQHQIKALFAQGSRLLIAGSILPEVNPLTGPRNVFLYDGTTFTPWQGGIGATNVSAIAHTVDGLWFSGLHLATTGTGPTLAPSVGIAHWQWKR